MSKLSVISRRLLPLYLAVFCQGVVFWYAIEKLFMTSIGFNDASIGAMVAVYSGIMLLIETPAGILADRWSRKGVLILSSIALGLSAIIGAVSGNVGVFIISTSLWGAYVALSSGTYDSIIYDVLQEEQGHSRNYEKFYGRHKVVEGIAFVVGALAGGAIAQLFGMREAFYYSIPFIIVSIVFLVIFKEPTIHKADAAASVKEHIGQTFSAVLKKRSLITILIGLVVLNVVMNSLFEFSQLWLIAVAAPVIIYGPASALVFSSWSLGGIIAKHIKSFRWTLIICATMLVSAVSLGYIHAAVVIIIMQTVLAIGIVGMVVVLTHQMHDQLPSRVRAGAASAVSTMTSVVIIPFALIFGILAHTQSVFVASAALSSLLAIGVVAIVWNNRLVHKRSLAKVLISE